MQKRSKTNVHKSDIRNDDDETNKESKEDVEEMGKGGGKEQWSDRWGKMWRNDPKKVVEYWKDHLPKERKWKGRVKCPVGEGVIPDEIAKLETTGYLVKYEERISEAKYID